MCVRIRTGVVYTPRTHCVCTQVVCTPRVYTHQWIHGTCIHGCIHPHGCIRTHALVQNGPVRRSPPTWAKPRGLCPWPCGRSTASPARVWDHWRTIQRSAAKASVASGAEPLAGTRGRRGATEHSRQAGQPAPAGWDSRGRTVASRRWPGEHRLGTAVACAHRPWAREPVPQAARAAGGRHWAGVALGCQPRGRAAAAGQPLDTSRVQCARTVRA